MFPYNMPMQAQKGAVVPFKPFVTRNYKVVGDQNHDPVSLFPG